MAGILYGVGVGPGDPELMTLKAVRLIRENDIIALPGNDPAGTTAYKIAAAAVPEIKDKELLAVYMPMVHDQDEQRKYHREGADLIESYLDQGKDVVFLTLGDVAIYSTFSYIQQLVETDGYECCMVSGVPSFCAAAARLGISIAGRDEQVHIIPAVYHLNEDLRQRGTVILMKSGSRMPLVREQIKMNGRDAMMVENCGMEDEAVYHHVEEIPDTAGYYSLIISKEEGIV